MKSETGFLIFAAGAAVLLFLFFQSVPLFGDTLGYGYRTTNWIRDNGYTPIATGEGRGEQAMGHSTLFFWLWAVLSGVLGETFAVARVLPAVSSFLALWGMYRLGKSLVSPKAGWLASIALLASPLFLIQSMRPMPESAVVAAVVWSLYFHIKGRYVTAAVLCALGVVFREQAIFLAGAFFFAEMTETGIKRPGRLLLFASPILVLIVTGIINLTHNGYFFFPTYLGEGSALAQGWFFQRLRFFAAHLLAEDFRWILVTAAVAGILKDRGRDVRALPFVLALLFPAVFYPPERLLFVLFAFCGIAVYMIRERLYTTKLSVVFILMPFFTVMFHVLIVLVSPDSALDLFRYILPAYPFVIVGGIAVLYRYYSKGTASALAIVFIVATALSNRVVHRSYQPDTSLACVKILRDYRNAAVFAVSLGDTVLVSGIDEMYFTEPECGVVNSPVPVRNILPGGRLEQNTEYTLVVASFMVAEGNIHLTEAVLPEGSRLVRLEEPAWEDGTNRVHIFRVLPE